MKTHLEDTNNNKKVKLDENGKINLSDIKTSVEFRIMKHREYIKKSEQTIIDNVDCANIITLEIEKINEREANIAGLS